MKFTSVIAAAILAATAYSAALPEGEAEACWYRGQPCSKVKRDLELVERDADACWYRGQPCSKVKRDIEV